MQTILAFVCLISLSSASLSFLVVGDWGTAADVTTPAGSQKAVAESMKQVAQAHPVQFVISVGDNFYKHGVSSTTDPLWKADFEDMYNHSSLNVPWYNMLGNHDYQGIVAAQLKYKKDPRWVFPARNYTFQYPVEEEVNVTFVMIDTSPFISDYYAHPSNPQMAIELKDQHWQAQVAWLASTLESIRRNDPKSWVIAIGHHYIFASEGDEEDMVNNLLPVLDKYGVSTYICGHAHNLQHIRPDDGTFPTDHFVSGAGGKVAPSLKGPLVRDEKARQQFFAEIGGFMIVDLEKSDMTLTFYNGEKAPVYTAKVNKPTH